MALDKAKELLETTSNTRAIEHIAFDWLEYTGNSDLIPIQTAQRMFEKTYDVEIKVLARKYPKSR